MDLHIDRGNNEHIKEHIRNILNYKRYKQKSKVAEERETEKEKRRKR
jgi:hypothetical protein